jgi:putative flippase GtrA
MVRKKLHVKIKKNLYDLHYDRYLQKCHAFINIGLGVWLAFVAIMATYLIDGNYAITKGVIMFSAIVTSFIFSSSLFFYWKSRCKRNDIEDKIKSLNPDAKNL